MEVYCQKFGSSVTMPLRGELRFKIFVIYLFKLSNYQRRRIIKYADCPINNECRGDQSYTYDIFLLCPYKYCLHKHIFCDTFSLLHCNKCYLRRLFSCDFLIGVLKMHVLKMLAFKMHILK